jgi:serine protease Do
MTRPFAESLGMTELYGAIFDRPEANSPAAHEHIEAGDVLTKINGEPLRDARDFQPIISAMAPGTIVYLTTYRVIRYFLSGGGCSRYRTRLLPKIPW